MSKVLVMKTWTQVFLLPSRIKITKWTIFEISFLWKHQHLCFHDWEYLTNFWHNNWRSIIDVVERLGSYDKLDCQRENFSDSQFLCFTDPMSLLTMLLIICISQNELENYINCLKMVRKSEEMIFLILLKDSLGTRKDRL